MRGSGTGARGAFIRGRQLHRANAAKESRIPREQLGEAAQVHHTVRQYLREVEEQNPVEEPVHEQDQVRPPIPILPTPPRAAAHRRAWDTTTTIWVDNHSCVIVGVQATAARMSQETVAAQDMLTRFAQWQGREPESVAADTTYGNGEFLQWLADRSITPYTRTRDSIHRKRSPFFGPERFTYEPGKQSLRLSCWPVPQLRWPSLSQSSLQLYRNTKKVWPVFAPATMHPCCLPGLIIHQNEPARQRARELVNTPEFAKAQRQRKKVEALFAELKNQIGLRRLRLRRLKFVREQFFLAAVAQNLKRLVRFLSQPTTPVRAAAARHNEHPGLVVQTSLRPTSGASHPAPEECFQTPGLTACRAVSSASPRSTRSAIAICR